MRNFPVEIFLDKLRVLKIMKPSRFVNILMTKPSELTLILNIMTL